VNLTVPSSRYASLGFELLYEGAQLNYAGTRIPSFFLSNATLSTRFRHSGWALSAGCYDLFNGQWATPTGLEVLAPATVQNRRTLQLRISYRKAMAR